MTMNRQTLLAPYRVLDLTDEKGWLCGRLLADLGADVVKVEPPGGDPGRRGPYYRDEPDPEHSLPWFAYNANKRGITLCLDHPAGQDLLRQLAARADFLLESFPPGYLDARGVGYPALRERNPRLIMVSITPFGQTGPYARWRGSDLVVMAMGGLMHLVGRPDGPPLRISLPQAGMWAGVYAAAAALIAHFHRERTGRGQHVDVSMQACLLSALANVPAYYSLFQQNLRRAGNFMVGRNVTGARLRAIYPCRDGYLNFILYSGEPGRRSNEAMIRWMVERGEAPEELAARDWNSFDILTATQQEIDAVERPIAQFLSQVTKAEFTEESLRRGILGYPVADARDIREDPHLAARGFWQRIPHPELETELTYPGPFARFSEADVGIRRRAPRIGEHNEEVYGELGLLPADLARLREQGVI